MKRTVLLLGIAAFFLMATAMISPAAADNVSGIYDSDGANKVVPGETYIAYNFTYTDSNNFCGTNLTWFNITNWNGTAIGWTSNSVSFDDIANITLWNATLATPVHIDHNNSISGFDITINLSDYWVPSGTKANITVNVTLNTRQYPPGLVNGQQIAFNASLKYIANATGATDWTIAEWANDTHAETISISSVPEFSPIGLIAFIGILSVVLAVAALRRKRGNK